MADVSRIVITATRETSQRCRFDVELEGFSERKYVGDRLTQDEALWVTACFLKDGSAHQYLQPQKYEARRRLK